MAARIMAVWPDRYLVEWVDPVAGRVRGGFILWRETKGGNNVSQIAAKVKKWRVKWSARRWA